MQRHYLETRNHGRLSRSLYSLEPFRYHLLYLFIFVLQQAKGVRNIVPLPLVLCAWQPGGELVGELFSVLVLRTVNI